MNQHAPYASPHTPLPWARGLFIPLALNLLVPALMLMTDLGAVLSDHAYDTLPTSLTGLCVMALTMLVATAWQQRKGGDYSARMRRTSRAILLPIALVSGVALLLTFKKLLFWYESQLPSLISVRVMTITVSELLLLWVSVARALPLWRQLNDRLRLRALRLAHIRAHDTPAPRSRLHLYTRIILPLTLAIALICILTLLIAYKAFNAGPCGEFELPIFSSPYAKVDCINEAVLHPVVISAHGN